MDKRLFDRTVGELVEERPALLRIFAALGIDTCCGGSETLEDACRKRELDRARVEALISGEVEPPGHGHGPEVDPGTLSLPALCDRIEADYHRPLRAVLPRLVALADKVARAHGRSDRRLLELAEVLGEFATELDEHMQKEERILFPAIRALAGGQESPDVHCGSILLPIHKMVGEHEDASLQLLRLSLLADGFEAPGWACSTYRSLLDGLLRLTIDLRAHIEVEEHILYPKVRTLERNRMTAGSDSLEPIR